MKTGALAKARSPLLGLFSQDFCCALQQQQQQHSSYLPKYLTFFRFICLQIIFFLFDILDVLTTVLCDHSMKLLLTDRNEKHVRGLPYFFYLFPHPITTVSSTFFLLLPTQYSSHTLDPGYNIVGPSLPPHHYGTCLSFLSREGFSTFVPSSTRVEICQPAL